MLGLFGIANSNIFAVSQTLKQRHPDLRLQVMGFEDKPKSKAQAILVPTVSLFLKNKSRLEKTKATVFVFDTPVLLDYLKPIKLLDAKRAGSFRYKLFSLTPSDLEEALAIKESVTVKPETVNVIPTLLHGTIPSIMKPILTFLYSVPNPEKRLEYRRHILQYFASEKAKPEKLKASLISLSPSKKSYKTLDKLIAFLSEPLPVSVKEIVVQATKAKAKGKSFNVSGVCTKANVASFDVKYILKSITKDSLTTFYPEGKTTEQVYAENRKAAK